MRIGDVDAATAVAALRTIPCLDLNGGPVFKHAEAFSFQIATIEAARQA